MVSWRCAATYQSYHHRVGGVHDWINLHLGHQESSSRPYSKAFPAFSNRSINFILISWCPDLSLLGLTASNASRPKPNPRSEESSKRCSLHVRRRQRFYYRWQMSFLSRTNRLFPILNVEGSESWSQSDVLSMLWWKYDLMRQTAVSSERMMELDVFFQNSAQLGKTSEYIWLPN